MSVRAKIAEQRLTDALAIRGKKSSAATTITFKEQAEKFLADGANRKRNPLRPSSLRAYKCQIETHLLPMIGSMTLDVIGNKVVSEVVSKMSEQGLSPRTISANVMIIKKIRRSAISENGDVLFPYQWSSEVIDAPATDGTKQPTVSAQAVQDAISKALTDGRPRDAALYAILAGTGLRIAEALAIKMAPDDGVSTTWIPSESKIVVRQQRGRGGLGPTKTKAGQREVDLGEILNLIGVNAPTDGFLFPDGENYYRDHLEKDGIEGGFHSFRRFRVTHLRMNGVPEALVKYWTGHAAGNITEQYTQVAGEIEARKTWAAKAGLGFELPEVK